MRCCSTISPLLVLNYAALVLFVPRTYALSWDVETQAQPSSELSDLMSNKRTVVLSPFLLTLDIALREPHVTRSHELSSDEEATLRDFTQSFLSTWFRLQLDPIDAYINVEVAMGNLHRSLQSAPSFLEMDGHKATQRTIRIVESQVEFSHVDDKFEVPTRFQLDQLTVSAFRGLRKEQFLDKISTIGNVHDAYSDEPGVLSHVIDVNVINFGVDARSSALVSHQEIGTPVDKTILPPFLVGIVLILAFLDIGIAMWLFRKAKKRRDTRKCRSKKDFPKDISCDLENVSMKKLVGSTVRLKDEDEDEETVEFFETANDSGDCSQQDDEGHTTASSSCEAVNWSNALFPLQKTCTKNKSPVPFLLGESISLTSSSTDMQEDDCTFGDSSAVSLELPTLRSYLEGQSESYLLDDPKSSGVTEDNIEE